MFSFIRTVISVIILLVAVSCFFVWHYRVAATSYLLSSLLNNPVTIGDVDVSLSLSRINGKNVGIVNPPKSRDTFEHAIKTKIFEFRTPFLNWFKKTFVIEEVYLDQVDFFVDMYNVIGTKNNIKTIIGNIHARAEARHPEGKAHKRPVVLNTIILQNIRFFYRNPVLTPGITELPIQNQIVLTNLGTGHSVSAAQIASIITSTLLRRFATLGGFKNMLENLPKLPINWFKNIFIREGTQAAIPLDVYVNLPQWPTRKSPSFFQKLFHSSKRPEEDNN